jgi:osmoprotectant transport system ATP-binding protein
MIELKNVTKKFKGAVTAVDDISFEVREGETFGLIGTSGCGKTTTLKMINRLIEPTDGEILLNAQSIINQPAEQLRRNIGYVIQSVGLFPHYTIEENISIVPKLLSWDRQEVSERSDELLELVGLEPGQYAERKPDALSGGQQQRVGLARALAGNPEVLLMDEPFGALDPITKENIRGEFKKLLTNLQKTVILVTHDVFEAFDLCDRICLMDQGKARQIGTPRELLFRPANDFVRSFFDAHRFQLEMMSITVGDILEGMKQDSASQEESDDPQSTNAGEAGSPLAEGTLRKDEEQARSEKPLNNKGEEGRKGAGPKHSRSAKYQGSRGEGQLFDPKKTDAGAKKRSADTISVRTPFFSVFENAQGQNEEYKVLNDEGEPIAVITPDDLLKGFQGVRAKLKEGRHD